MLCRNTWWLCAVFIWIPNPSPCLKEHNQTTQTSTGNSELSLSKQTCNILLFMLYSILCHINHSPQFLWKNKFLYKSCLCLTKHNAMKMYWGSGGIVPGILDLGTRWRWVVSFMPWPLYTQGKSPWYHLDRRLAGHQNCSGHSGEEKNSQPPPGIDEVAFI